MNTIALFLSKVCYGFLNAYRAPSGTSWQARLILFVLRLKFGKDTFDSASPDTLLAAADLRSKEVPSPPVPSAGVHVRETKAYSHLSASKGVWKFFTIEPSLAESTGSASPIPERPFVLYLHGGAYSATVTDTHFQFLYELCEKTGCSILVPCYPRPPDGQVTHKEMIDVLLALMQELRGSKRTVEHGTGVPRQETTIHSRTSKRFILMGDSAGGGLAVALLLELLSRDANECIPHQLILNAPWLDVELKSDDMVHFDTADPWLSIPFLRVCGQLWAGSNALTSSRLVSPAFASNEDLLRLKTAGTEITIFHGTVDILFPGTRDFVKRLNGLGVPNRFIEGRGQAHVYPILPTWIPEVREARELIYGLVRSGTA